MKFNRNIISIVVALALGFVAIMLLNIYLAKEKVRIAAEKDQKLGKEVDVVIAATDIARGSKINSPMIKLGKVRESNLQPRAISSPNAVIDKIVIADILAGEQVSFTKLMSGPSQTEASSTRPTGGISSSGLAMKIPSGKRAFTIAIDEVSAAGGMLKPNDYIDVLGTFPFTQNVEGKAITQNVTVTLFQNVLVLAVGKQIAPAASEGPDQTSLRGANTVTVALIPQQVELFNFAQDLGKLRLILRPPLETTVTALPPVTADVLWQQILTQAGMQLPQQQKVETPKEEEPGQTVDVYRGQKKETVTLK